MDPTNPVPFLNSPFGALAPQQQPPAAPVAPGAPRQGVDYNKLAQQIPALQKLLMPQQGAAPPSPQMTMHQPAPVAPMQPQQLGMLRGF